MKQIVLVIALLSAAGCAGNKAPIVVGNSAVAVANSIGALNQAGKQLTDAAVIAPAVNLRLQQVLLAANDKLKPLPDILRTIDHLQTAGSSTASETDRAIAILQVVGQDISIAIAGVPVSDATAKLIELVRAAQQTVQTVLVQVAQIRGRS